MGQTTDPEELFRRGIDLLLRGDLDGWLATCAEDVVFEFPSAPADRPHSVTGRAALGQYMCAYLGQVSDPQIRRLVVHHATDSGVAAEMTMRGRHRSTGTLRESSSIAVLTVVDGLITHYRDYWNPLGGTEITESAEGAEGAASLGGAA